MRRSKPEVVFDVALGVAALALACFLLWAVAEITETVLPELSDLVATFTEAFE